MAAAVDNTQQQQQQQAAAAQQQQKQASQKSRSSRKHRHKHHDKKDMRTIGRWYIGETLGKGGYSWVKKGYDKKTGKCVALKFMAKADESWVAEQSKQVVTEIESLKQIRHSNVMKLYAYNLNARYPSKDAKSGKETTTDTILLVLEYAPGGELFDILYYTSALEELVARTYFRQIIAGLDACHKAGVVHRDLKPQNLLLDSRFNIKITDFGLSKLQESDADAQMKTTYVGTRGYQAPELLLDKPYDLSCDIFSIGVVLFILMTGYPPFEQATATDRWYKSMTKKDYKLFWKAHRASPLANNEDAKELIQRMLAFEPKDRITIAEIKKHPFYNGKYLEGKDLIRALRNRHKEMEMKRKKDSRKQADLQTSVKKALDYRGAVVPPLLPFDADETVGFLHTVEDWQLVLDTLADVIGATGGVADYDLDTMTLCCKMSTANQNELQHVEVFEFVIQVFLSDRYNDEKVLKAMEQLKVEALAAQKKADIIAADNAKDGGSAAAKDAAAAGDDGESEAEKLRAQQLKARGSVKACYAIRIARLKGDEMKFARKIRQNFLMVRCGSLFSGVPNERLKSEEKDDGKNTSAMAADDDDFFMDDESDEDYDDILKNEGSGLGKVAMVSGGAAAAAVAIGAGGDDAKVDG